MAEQATTIQQVYELVTKRTEIKLARLDKKFAQTLKASQESAKGVARFGKTLQGLKRTIGTLGIAVGLVAAFDATAGAAIRLESAMAGVKKTLPERADFAEIEAGLRELSTQIPTTVIGLAELAETAGQLGVAADQILPFTETMAKLAETTDIVGREGATQLARFAGLAEEGAPKFDRVASAIVDLGNNSKATEAEILKMATRMAAAGKSAGLSSAEILGLAAAARSVGVEAEAGGTAFNRFLNEMKAAAITGGEAARGFADIAGMTSDAFSELFKEDAAAAVQAFIEGLQDIEKSGGSTSVAMDKLGFEGARMKQVFQSLAGAGDLVKESMDRSAKAYRENTALAKEAAQRHATLASQLKVVKNLAIALGVSVGEVMTPGLTAAAQATGFFLRNLKPIAAAIAAGFVLTHITAFVAAIGVAKNAFVAFQGAAALQTALASMSTLSVVATRTGQAVVGAAGSMSIATAAFSQATTVAAAGAVGLGAKMAAMAAKAGAAIALLGAPITWAGVTAAISTASAFIVAQFVAIGAAAKALWLLLLAHPAVLVAAAIGAIVIALVKLNDHLGIVGTSIKDFNKFVSKQTKELAIQDKQMEAYRSSVEATGVSFETMKGIFADYVNEGENLVTLQERLIVLQRAADAGNNTATEVLRRYNAELKNTGTNAKDAAVAQDELTESTKRVADILDRVQGDTLEGMNQRLEDTNAAMKLLAERGEDASVAYQNLAEDARKLTEAIEGTNAVIEDQPEQQKEVVESTDAVAESQKNLAVATEETAVAVEEHGAFSAEANAKHNKEMEIANEAATVSFKEMARAMKVVRDIASGPTIDTKEASEQTRRLIDMLADRGIEGLVGGARQSVVAAAERGDIAALRDIAQTLEQSKANVRGFRGGDVFTAEASGLQNAIFKILRDFEGVRDRERGGDDFDLPRRGVGRRERGSRERTERGPEIPPLSDKTARQLEKLIDDLPRELVSAMGGVTVALNLDGQVLTETVFTTRAKGEA